MRFSFAEVAPGLYRPMIFAYVWGPAGGLPKDGLLDTGAAANCLRIRDHLLMPAGYPKTAQPVQRFAEDHGIKVTPLNISEFEKGGGSLSCLSLIW